MYTLITVTNEEYLWDSTEPKPELKNEIAAITAEGESLEALKANEKIKASDISFKEPDNCVWVGDEAKLIFESI